MHLFKKIFIYLTNTGLYLRNSMKSLMTKKTPVQLFTAVSKSGLKPLAHLKADLVGLQKSDGEQEQ